MSAARSFRFCSASGLQAMKQRVTDAFAAWAEERLCAGAAPAFSVQAQPCSAPAVAAAGARVPSLAAHGAHGSFWLDAEQGTVMQHLLFGGIARADGMASAIAQQALSDLVEAVADAAPRPCAQEVIDLSVPGRALAELRIHCQDHALVLLTELPDPNLLPLRPAGASAPAGSYTAALMPQQVMVRATLGEVEIDLGTLHMLRPGDVLRLDKRLDEPVELDIAGERVHCDAFLVASGPHKAVELNRSASPNPTPKAPSHA
jgi:flagellar motor switch/type III secretory pathway protein FliN